MLQIYRRHRETCEHREDRKYARCRCPIWLSGSLRGQQVRESLKEDNWERAQQLARDWEANATKPKEEIRHSIEKRPRITSPTPRRASSKTRRLTAIASSSASSRASRKAKATST